MKSLAKTSAVYSKTGIFYYELMNIVQTLKYVAMIFFRKRLEICSGSNVLFCGLTFDFF